MIEASNKSKDNEEEQEKMKVLIDLNLTQKQYEVIKKQALRRGIELEELIERIFSDETD
tara:strand:- start:930 stop:1106 length:177 start_codon:yes stop_codon:yes gene_type:complete